MVNLNADHKVLTVELNNEKIRAVTGSMVAYDGNLSFKGAGVGGGGGFKAALKQHVAGETLSMMECSGTGKAYFAVDAQDVTVIDLNGDTLAIESEQLLALSDTLTTNVKFTGLGGISAKQGLATTTVTGTGQVALLSKGPVIGLEVDQQNPVTVDPQAYLGSYGNLNQSFVRGITWKTFIGEGNGEPFSINFNGHGTVLIQPTER